MSARVSGLSDEHAAGARRIIMAGVHLFMVNPDAIHYTQGPLRWEGIDHHLRIAKGEIPHHGDCSSTHSFLLWNGLTHVHPGISDIVNGERWLGGFTGTIARHGKQVHRIENLKVGDAVLYGPGPNFEHVATAIGGGRVFSHGGEAGPFILPADYRPIAQMRRHI